MSCDVSNLNNRHEIYKLALQHAYGPTVDLENGCVLAARNEDVDEINDFALEGFPGFIFEAYSADNAKEGQEHLYPVEFLNSIQPNGFLLHKLRLKAC